MPTKEEITQTVFNAIDEVNSKLPEKSTILKSLDTPLIGSSANLDSMGMIYLIVATEQKIVEAFSVKIALVDDDTIFSHASPFKSLGKFIDFIYVLLSKKKEEN